MGFKSIFKKKAIIGMVHLLPLPSSALFDGNVAAIEERAIKDAEALISAGVDGFIIENFEDTPYQENISIEAYSVMLSIVEKIKKITTIPFGVNIQFNGVEQEWAMAYATGANFLRAETFVETRLGVHGVSYPSAPDFMRLKNRFPSDCLIFADVNVKHTHGLINVPLKEAAENAIESGADAIIVTGKATGCNPEIEDLIELRKIVGDFPILVGSGIKESNIKEYLKYADGVIAGSSIKKDGNVHLEVDEERVKKLIQASE